MAAPFVLSGILVDPDTVYVYMSEELMPEASSNPGQYVIRNLLTSGLVSVLDVEVPEDSTIITLTTNPHIAGNYRVTVSGVVDMDKEIIDYNNNTADYSYIIPTLEMTLVTPAGGESYLGGQLKTITWNLTFE